MLRETMARARVTLVTGATGFIGTHVVRALVAGGDRVLALVRRTSVPAAVLALGAEIVHGDLADPDSLRAAVGPGVDRVVQDRKSVV